jgi:PTH1 family peptidyl-tRNA hydrolase
MDSKCLIVGLGNPGPKYHDTRHNLGFMVIDRILELGETRKSMRLTRLDESGDYELWRANFAGATRLLCKPMTYMNLSGKAVSKVCGRHGIQPDSVLVLHDELDLPTGRMKIKKGGSNNGHRGLESIQQCLNTAGFLRLRLGIGRPPEPYREISDWVLDTFSTPETAVLPETINAAVKGIDLLLRRGMGQAQQFIHRFKPEAARQENAANGIVDS